MRGGAFRDESWVRNPLQPTVVTSTVDQVGSRLLFRGYGVSRNSWPLHAGLIGNDALILLDEARCSRAFAQTLKRVEGYRGNGWTSRPLGLPFQFVEMTGTPSRKVKLENRVGLSPADLEVEALRKRLDAEKPTQRHTLACWLWKWMPGGSLYSPIASRRSWSLGRLHGRLGTQLHRSARPIITPNDSGVVIKLRFSITDRKEKTP
jgi:hypothetical protein